MCVCACVCCPAETFFVVVILCVVWPFIFLTSFVKLGVIPVFILPSIINQSTSLKYTTAQIPKSHEVLSFKQKQLKKKKKLQKWQDSWADILRLMRSESYTRYTKRQTEECRIANNSTKVCFATEDQFALAGKVLDMYEPDWPRTALGQSKW